MSEDEPAPYFSFKEIGILSGEDCPMGWAVEEIIVNHEPLGIEEAPSTESELTAAKMVLAQLETAQVVTEKTEITVLIDGASPFCVDMTLADDTYGNWSPPIPKVPLTDVAHEETVSENLKEAPNTEKEFALIKVVKKTPRTVGTYSTPMETTSDLGEIATFNESYHLEVPTSDGVANFEPIAHEELAPFRLEEAPNTEKEFALVEVIHEVPQTVATFNTPQEAPSDFGEIATLNESYDLEIQTSNRAVELEPIVHEELAPFRLEEAPNTEKEFALVEVIHEVPQTVATYNTPQEAPFEFGEIGTLNESYEVEEIAIDQTIQFASITHQEEELIRYEVIGEEVQAYSDFHHTEIQNDLSDRSTEIEQILSSYEYERFEEAPDTQNELLAAESDLSADKEPKIVSESMKEKVVSAPIAQKNPEPTKEKRSPPRIAKKPLEPKKAKVLLAPIAKKGPTIIPAFLSRFKSVPEKPAPDPLPPPPAPSSKSLDSFPWPKFISIRHTWGDQENEYIPFATNYTTLDLLFAPDYRLGKVMPFLDLRGHRFDNNTYAANCGLGGRYIPNPAADSFCEVLGFNAYYDFRQGSIGYYNQIGVGVEILGKRWDIRANAYAPFGKKRHIFRCIYDDYEGDYYAIRDSIESISYSFNGELGFLLIDSWKDSFSLYGAAGPYFISRTNYNNGVVGGEARLRPQYKDYLALDLSWRYDPLFETIWQIQFIINLPLYQISGNNKKPCGMLDRQIYQQIDRFEVMPLSRRTCWTTNF